MRQAQEKGWLTYTDLSVIWDNTDLHYSMLKHTAKVCDGCGLKGVVIIYYDYFLCADGFQ